MTIANGETLHRDGVQICDTAFTLPNTPTAWAWVAGWNAANPPPKEVDLCIYANGAINLTNMQLLALSAHLGTAPTTLLTAVTNASDLFTKNTHGLQTGDGPMQWTTAGTLPSGLSLLTDYYVIIVDVNTFKVATSFENAMAGTVVAIADDGTGMPTLTAEADCRRVSVHESGKLLGKAEDGAIVVSANLGYEVRRPHRAATVAYSIKGTLSTNDPEGVTAEVQPVFERP